LLGFPVDFDTAEVHVRVAWHEVLVVVLVWCLHVVLLLVEVHFDLGILEELGSDSDSDSESESEEEEEGWRRLPCFPVGLEVVVGLFSLHVVVLEVLVLLWHFLVVLLHFVVEEVGVGQLVEVLVYRWHCGSLPGVSSKRT